MAKTLPPFTLLAATSALLAGCVGASDRYPSLAIRDAERQLEQSAPEPATGPPPATSPQTFGQLREIVEGARTAHQQFIADQPGANALAQASRGADGESDLRAQALIAAAGLSILHSQTNLALSDLDHMQFSAASTFAPVEDISAAQILIGQMIAEQDAALDSLDTVMTP